MQSPDPRLVGCVNKVGFTARCSRRSQHSHPPWQFLSSGWVMLSNAFKRYSALASCVALPPTSCSRMNPSDSRTSLIPFRLSPYRRQLVVCTTTATGLGFDSCVAYLLHPTSCSRPVLHCFSSDTCHPCYPGKFNETLPFSGFVGSGLPL
jgi:hypothetical protein